VLNFLIFFAYTLFSVTLDLISKVCGENFSSVFHQSAFQISFSSSLVNTAKSSNLLILLIIKQSYILKFLYPYVPIILYSYIICCLNKFYFNVILIQTLEFCHVFDNHLFRLFFQYPGLFLQIFA